MSLPDRLIINEIPYVREGVVVGETDLDKLKQILKDVLDGPAHWAWATSTDVKRAYYTEYVAAQHALGRDVDED